MNNAEHFEIGTEGTNLYFIVTDNIYNDIKNMVTYINNVDKFEFEEIKTGIVYNKGAQIGYKKSTENFERQLQLINYLFTDIEVGKALHIIELHDIQQRLKYMPMAKTDSICDAILKYYNVLENIIVSVENKASSLGLNA